MRGSKGFTLLELLVAVAVAVTVLASIYGVYAGVSRARDHIEERSAMAHQARVLFDRVGRELRGTFPAGGDAHPFAGGTDARTGNTFLRFTTTADTPEGGNRGGIRTLRYELFPGTSPQELGELKRSETPAFLGEPQQDRSYRMLTGVGQWKLRFFSDDAWRDEWQETKGRQPQAVEMTLTLRAGKEETTFVSAVELPNVVPLQ